MLTLPRERANYSLVMLLEYTIYNCLCQAFLAAKDFAAQKNCYWLHEAQKYR